MGNTSGAAMLEPNAIEIVMALLALLAVALFIWAIIGLAFRRRFRRRVSAS